MAKYKGRTVKLNKIQRGDVKKFKVFVKFRTYLTDATVPDRIAIITGTITIFFFNISKFILSPTLNCPINRS